VRAGIRQKFCECRQSFLPLGKKSSIRIAHLAMQLRVSRPGGEIAFRDRCAPKFSDEGFHSHADRVLES
jgi:hypothetical protein